MASRQKPQKKGRPWIAILAAVAAVPLALGTTGATTHPSFHLAANQTDATGLPPELMAEIAANDAAGLPGLGNGVTVPAGCDIRTSLDPQEGRPRIENERTVHRQMNVGNTPEFIAAGNAQLEQYLQVSVRDYCADDTT